MSFYDVFDAATALVNLAALSLICVVTLTRKFEKLLTRIVSLPVLTAMIVAAGLGGIVALADVFEIKNDAVFSLWQSRRLSDALVFLLMVRNIHNSWRED